MAGRKPKDKNRIDVDYIVSWALWKSGVPVKKIAEDKGITKSAVYWQIDQVRQALKQKINPEELLNAVYLCFPAAIESLLYNLRVEKDASVTNNFLNKTVFKDVKESESHTQTNIYNLGPEFDQIIEQADIELLKEIRDRLRDRNRKVGTPPVVSRVKDSSQH